MIRPSDKTTLPAPGDGPVSLPPEVRVDDGEMRRFQRQLVREHRNTVAKQIGAGLAGLVSFAAVLHTLVDVVGSWKRPPEKPTVTCPAPEDTPPEPFDGICQRLKRAEAKAKSAQADAAECFQAKARTERALGDLEAELQEVEGRLPKKKRVTNPGD